MDKMVEIARFQNQAEAFMLRSLLESEGIECYLKDEIINQMYGGFVDFGGIKVQVMEDQVPHAMDVMQANGYELPKEDEAIAPLAPMSGFVGKIPFLRKFALEKQLLIILIVTALLLALLVYAGSIF
ncbi:MAG: DUF2007 domain-containing protein [Parabacteroides sp.]|jgi:hypothetical protein|uniref:DUF2007 domain-containing protein n=1 Tax=Macellibacteroides fermentans TaxID=879969 RepID=A0A8E2A0A8_9PORP|nr:DUF2007 domain-containing protein [Macellibacteroides fermentans]MBP7939088.1 DUF2007 domain-containing protein [Parabacteroides sp.]MDD3255554.1 DUF2007 domain-containing protein [Parabacteroides sp.]MDD3507088.1 DUF2007 domain-containing protein [Parabacteroides sp.]MEA4809207.1 DUF2007 domain-containing protein [Macellibacteroides fermentans]NYI49180.1 hypothetical protein [Macellibacteroides fermentans]